MSVNNRPLVTKLYTLSLLLANCENKKWLKQEGVDVDGMKKRLKEMEEEVAALHEMQAKVESHLDSAQGFFFVFFLGGV